MAKLFKPHFTTGEFAKLCGVNKRTLFHYDDIELFQPAIKDKNGYRFYSYNQVKVFFIISIFKELNVPLKQIKKYLDERTPELMLNLSKTKINEIDKEIERLNYVKYSLQGGISYILQGLQVDFTKIFIEEQDEEKLILSELIDYETKDSIKSLMDFLDFEYNTSSMETSFAGKILTKERILNQSYDDVDYFYVKTTSIEPNTKITIKSKGLYAVSYHRGDYEMIGKTYENMLAFLKRNNLEMNGFAYEEFLIDEICVKSVDDYVTRITMDIKLCN
ncbi:MerR family transcriptional regulator [Clostridium intestinale]|uniref:MerR family transcriptional regulator n=1 Tax=Clostridium intestinale TaxID=36845 RepID=UPI002DD682B6|nr:MerR family transcriptional regulator [Clostridium intestinale]WRY52005.1 MerR family transcriptional regulator [Clostridium intestinale]